MPHVQVCTFDRQGAPTPGLAAADQVVALDAGYAALEGAPPAPASLLELMGEVPRHEPHLTELAEALASGKDKVRKAAQPLSGVKLYAPLLYPGKILCAGANYYDHIKEMGGQPPDKSTEDPYFFVKTGNNCVIGNGDDIVLPKPSKAVDWEVELAVVIGRRCKEVSPDEVMEVIGGYTILMDVSVRDLMRRPKHTFIFDWIMAKCFDSAAPMGPWIVLKSSDIDPQNLGLRLSVNEVIKQDSNTNQMIFDIVEQITWITSIMTLEPGDVVSTGTPAGVGNPRQEFLKSGDVVKCEIDAIGTLINPVTAPSA